MKLKHFLGITALSLAAGISFGASAYAADGTSIETATTLSINGAAHKNTMTEEDHCFWYKYTVPSNIGNKWITISVTNSMDQLAEYTIYDSEENYLSSESISEGETKNFLYKVSDSSSSYHTADNDSVETVTPGATYYIKADGYIYGDVSGNYSLQITSASDDNWGTEEQAPVLSIGTKKTATLEKTDDIDCYKFTLPDDEQIYTISVGMSYNCTAKLLDENSSEIFCIYGYNYGKYFETLEWTGDGGTYYIQFGDSEVDNTPYAVKVSKGQTQEDVSVNLPAVGTENDTTDDTTPDDSTSTDTTPTDSSKTDTDTKKENDPPKQVVTKLVFKKVSITAKKKTKKIIVSTTKGAKITVSLKRKIIKDGTKKVKTISKTAQNGKVTITLSKKLKKGEKIKISLSKKGYTTKNLTIKVK